MSLLAFAKQRLKEPSTWIAVIPLMAGVIGLEISHEAATTILAVVVTFAGAVGIITPDKKK